MHAEVFNIVLCMCIKYHTLILSCFNKNYKIFNIVLCASSHQLIKYQIYIYYILSCFNKKNTKYHMQKFLNRLSDPNSLDKEGEGKL